MTTATTAAAPPCRPHPRLRGASVTLVLLALASGCASTAPAHAAHAAHATSPAGAPTAAAAPTALPATSDLYSACHMPSSRSSESQLKTVEVVAEGDQLVLAFTLTQPVTGNLTVKVVASAETTNGSTNPPQGFSVTAALRNRVPVAVALQTPAGSSSAGQPQDLVHVIDNQVHIGVPSSLLNQLGPRWHWSASTASATSHAQCPATTQAGDPATIAVGS
jgi:hypothetical protein